MNYNKIKGVAFETNLFNYNFNNTTKFVLMSFLKDEKKIYLNELLTDNVLFLPKHEEPPVVSPIT